MFLDFKFVFFGSLVILSLIPLYIYRKEIYKRFSKKGNIKVFIKDLKAYLTYNYPKINFNFDIVEKIDEKDLLKTKQILIIEDLARQFVYFEYELSTQKGVPKEKLWSSYDQNSTLHKDNKFPIDWPQRKEAAWNREEGNCNRCGTKTKLVDANALLAKQMKNGGGFNLENVVILCNDCARIIKSQNLEKTKKDLNFLDKLMKKVSY
jgi:hypothetical protein